MQSTAVARIRAGRWRQGASRVRPCPACRASTGCPLHAFEFDVTTGECLGDPEKLRVRTLHVSTVGEDVVAIT